MTAPLLAIDNFGFAGHAGRAAGHPLLSPRARREPVSQRPLGQRQDHPARSDRRRAKAARGSVRLLDRDLGSLSAGARDRFRVDHTGYIFQQFNLLPFLSVRENVGLPCHFRGCVPNVRASGTAARTPPRPACWSTWGWHRSCSSGEPMRSPSASSSAWLPPER